tara:strand:+ start:92 stop:1627 length:1536 start_codon:yes stop_codon:yes gene_type:complete
MISIDTTPVKLILKNPNWAEDQEILDYFVEQAKLVEDYILNKKKKSKSALIASKPYLDGYLKLSNEMKGKTNHKFQYDVLVYSLDQQVHQCVNNLIDDFYDTHMDGGWSFSLQFGKLKAAEEMFSAFEINFDNLKTSESYFNDIRDTVVKGYISSELYQINKSYSSKNEEYLAELKLFINERGLTEYFKGRINQVKNANLEDEILTRLEKAESSGGRPVLESAWEIDKYFKDNPNINHISNQRVEDVTQRVIDMLVKYSLNEAKCFKHRKFNDLNTNCSLNYNYFYKSLTFYPNVTMFKEKNGLNGLKLFGQNVTEELLEILYSHSITKELKFTRINTFKDPYHEQVDHSSIVDHMKVHYLRYLGYGSNFNFYVEFFKEKASRAVVLRAMQAAYEDEKEFKGFNLACLELVDIVMAECPNLTLEDFCLTEEIVAKIHADEITSKEAFAEAASAKWFDDEVMSKSYRLVEEKKDKSVLSKVCNTINNNSNEMPEVNPGLLGKVGNFFKTNFL